MLSNRVRTKEFEEAMKKGRITHSPLFLVKVMAAEDAGMKSAPSRVATVAPVKVAKTAVLRNRTRRRIYEAVRPVVGEIKSGLIIILFAKPPALNIEFSQLKTGVKDVFVKAGVLG